MEDFIPPNCRSVSLPQMKIGRNENSFPFYLQRQNCGNDRFVTLEKRLSICLLYICIYIYMYMNKYIYMCVCVCVYIYI